MVESLGHAQQRDYCLAIKASTAIADAAPFITFMLTLLRAALAEFTPQVLSLLRCLRGNMSRDALQLALMLKDRKSFRALYLSPALEAGFIAMTLPDKPNSRLQQYRLTEAGSVLL